MNWQFNIYVFALAFNFLIGAFLFGLIRKKKETSVAKYFSLFLLGITFYDFATTFELSSTVLNTKIFFSKVSYFGAVSTAVFWLFFTASFSQKTKIITSKYSYLFWVIPTIILIAAFTNEHHHLVWPNVYLENTKNGVIAIYKHGIIFYTNVIYSYLLMMYGTYLLISQVVSFPRVYKKQAIIFILAAVIPWAGDLLYVLGVSPIYGVDFGGFLLTVSALLVTYGLLKLKLFQITPIAKELIYESISEAVIVINTDNLIIEINKQAKQLLQKDFNEGDNFEEILNQFINVIDVINLQKEFTDEIEFSGADKTKVLEIKISPIISITKEHLGLVILLRDITERKIYETTLIDSEKNLIELNNLKNKFFSIISHDLKSPFSALLGFCQILKEDYKKLNDEEREQIIEAINKSAKGLFTLTEDLLEWSKQNISSGEIVSEKVDVKNEIISVIDLLQPAAFKKNIDIQINTNEEVYAEINPDILQLILRNLITNAVKFSKPGGKVLIASEKKDDKIILSVEDSGTGMEKWEVENLFKLDHKFSKRGTNGEIGSGLGLIICKDAVEKIGEIIWVESKTGIGTKFFFTIPAI